LLFLFLNHLYLFGAFVSAHHMFRRTTWLAALLVMLMGIVDGEYHGEVAAEVVDTTLEYKSMEAGSVIDL